MTRTPDADRLAPVVAITTDQLAAHLAHPPRPPCGCPWMQPPRILAHFPMPALVLAIDHACGMEGLDIRCIALVLGSAAEAADTGLATADTAMTRQWGGRRTTQARLFVVARDHGMCWLCNHGGATSLDHVIPFRDRPDLEWVESNWKAAHLTRAGTPTGCTVPGCSCIGNKARKATPHTPPPSRDW